MENLLSGRLKNNFSDEKILALVSNKELKPARLKTLSDYTKTIYIQNENEISFNTELSDNLTRRIIQKLANAIDKNSVEEVKKLKFEYGHEKEFKKAQKFLNDKCKQVWNVYDNPINPPLEAMKVLGITNKPSLDFILNNSIKIFEKDGGNMTARMIESILNNKNLDYTIDDIHKYLCEMSLKEKCKYNAQTVKYLILTHNYDKLKLSQIGVNKEFIKEILKSLTLKQKAQNINLGLSLCFN